MSLRAYVNETLRSWPIPAQKGMKGRESDWLELCEFILTSDRVLLVDPGFDVRSNKGLIVELPSGSYVVQGKLMHFGFPMCYWSRMRVLPRGLKPVLGKDIGKAPNVSHRLGVCDQKRFSESWERKLRPEKPVLQFYSENTVVDLADEWGEDYDHGIAVLNWQKAAVMPYFSSGFGFHDGSTVLELLLEGKRVGLEAEFIKEGTEYPDPTYSVTTDRPYILRNMRKY